MLNQFKKKIIRSMELKTASKITFLDMIIEFLQALGAMKYEYYLK